jgi:hypothetical protein
MNKIDEIKEQRSNHDYRLERGLLAN